MDTEDLALFAEAARLGSFTAAARARGVDPSSVSRAVAGLEAAVGVRLFQRTTRRIALTEAGELWLARAGPLLEELQRVREEARNLSAEPAGVLRLTASTSFGQRVIVPLLPAFRARHPGIALECLFTDATLDLVAERVDLAVRLAPAVTGDLVAARLMRTRYRVVASPGYLAGAPPLARPWDLSAHRCVLFALREWRGRWRFREGAGPVEEVEVAGDLVISPAGAVRDAAVAGLGPALLADWLVGEDLREGRLVDCLPRHEATATTFETGAWAVYPSRAFLPGKVRAMVEHLRERLARGTGRGRDGGARG